MLINSEPWTTIWLDKKGCSFHIIDQTKLPHRLETLEIRTFIEARDAIKNMQVRGAPLIGVTGAYGFMLGLMDDPSDKGMRKCFELLISARPTAVNLQWSLERMLSKVIRLESKLRCKVAQIEAREIEKEDINMCSLIGDNGKNVLEEISKNKQHNNDQTLNILTHCNAGWLATVDWGTALAPIYKAHRAGIDIHVWVDETRPRNQGASLTSFELSQERIAHTVIVDNAGGHLMQERKVDLVIVGSDRTTREGDVCNKIGTYLKALAAKDNNIPFYVALPFSTIDWNISNGFNEIPIEVRSSDEVKYISGKNKAGSIEKVQLIPDDSNSYNPGFDITPAKLITALITEKGVSKANYESLRRLYN